MQPDRMKSVTADTFERMKGVARRYVEDHRLRSAQPELLPEVIGVKLTNRCNLRCAHCYQWNKDGYHRDLSKEEQLLDLDPAIFQELLNETREYRSRLYLWGGEPLFHRQIASLLDMLRTEEREVTICTNAYYLTEHIDALCQMSSRLELLIAIEGFKEQHDSIRGKGSFERVMEQVDRLLALRANGQFKGKISVHTVISDGNINRLFELLTYFEEKGIDLVLLCFPWYISPETSEEMNHFVNERFAWMLDDAAQRHSWDAFKYAISPLNVPGLLEDLRRINAKPWKMQLRYQPGLEFSEIENFVLGKAMTAACATKCSVLTTRVDVLPSGKVSACKFFNEFAVGDLNRETLTQIWTSERYQLIRSGFEQGLSPACSKCNTLYLQEHSVPLHI